MAALLQARNLRAFYAQAEVLHGIDFALHAGGITTILGANGAGKTTTLRAVCGMVRTQGEISFDARRIDGKKTEEIARVRHRPRARWPRHLSPAHHRGEFEARRSFPP